MSVALSYHKGFVLAAKGVASSSGGWLPLVKNIFGKDLNDLVLLSLLCY